MKSSLLRPETGQAVMGTYNNGTKSSGEGNAIHSDAVAAQVLDGTVHE
jgi:hypothetical protein